MRLAETYINVEFLEEPHIDLSDESQFDRLAIELKSGVVILTRQIFVRDVKLEYLLEKGTLIERVKVIGKPLVVAIGLVAGYHELRESIIDIYKDATYFSDVVVKQFHQMTNTKPSDVRFKRTIPNDVSWLHRIVQNIDQLDNPNLYNAERYKKRDEIVADITRLHWANPQDPGVQVVLDNLPKKRIPEMPTAVDAVVRLDERRRRASRLQKPVGRRPKSVEPEKRQLETRIKRRHADTVMI